MTEPVGLFLLGMITGCFCTIAALLILVGVVNAIDGKPRNGSPQKGKS